MSTTWVFLGLLAGREFALVVSLKVSSLDRATRTTLGDMGKAVAGMAISVVIAMSMPYLAAYTGGYSHDPDAVPVVSPD